MTQINSYTNKIKTILPQMVEWFNVISTLYLIASLILSFKYQKPAIYIYAISTATDIIVNKRYLNAKWDKTKYTFIIMITYYLCIWIWHIFEQCNSTIFFHSLDTRLPFLIFGILGLCVNINPKIKLSYIAYTMIISAITSIIYVILQKYNIIFTPTITIDLFRKLLPHIRHELLHVTHIEFNVYLNCAMSMCFIQFIESKKRLEKILLVSCIIFIFIALLFNEGRTGFATASILFFIFTVISIYYYKPKFLIPTLLVLIITIILFINGHERLNIDNIEHDPRGIIWKLTTEIIKEEPLFGHGVCNGRQLFVERSINNPDMVHFWEHWHQLYPNYNKNRFHCHNAYLESMLEFGIFGMIITILIFLLPILLTTNKKQLYLSLFILIFSIQAMFESFTFHLQIILFCWLIYFFTNIKQLDNN